MKINGGSIFGLTLIGVGVLFAIWGFTARTPSATSPSPEGNVWYYVLAAGLLVTGVIIGVLSQALNSSPPAEVGSTKEEPRQ